MEYGQLVYVQGRGDLPRATVHTAQRICTVHTQYI